MIAPLLPTGHHLFESLVAWIRSAVGRPSSAASTNILHLIMAITVFAIPARPLPAPQSN
jgi:hypothetical protein